MPVAVGAIAGLALAPTWPLDATVKSAVAQEVALHAHAREAIDAIQAGLGPKPSWRGALPASKTISATKLVVVPPTMRGPGGGRSPTCRPTEVVYS